MKVKFWGGERERGGGMWKMEYTINETRKKKEG